MSRTEQIEIERKYDVDGAVRVPDLRGTGPVETVAVDEPVLLRAVYFDTAEHLLLANRITLRRRTGGHDAGWHVKLPAGLGARRELHAPLGIDPDEALPATLRHAVEIVLRGRPLHAVLVLETTRTATHLLDADGRALAELADDEVEATHPGTAEVRRWREWELELAPGISRADGESLQDAVGDALQRAGASASASVSKLSRGLGDALPAVVVAAPADPSESAERPKKSSAGAFVTRALDAAVTEFQELDGPTREGEDDAVHRFRTATRRLRGILRLGGSVLDADEAARVDDALARIGRAAGASRDLEVALALVDRTALAAPESFVAQETLGRLRASLRESARDAAHDLDRAMTDPSYFELLDRLDRLVEVVPSGEDAGRKADDVVAGRLRKATRRARRRLDAAVRSIESGEVDLALVHSARKATRTLRYEHQAARRAGVTGSASRKAARRAHDVQDVLGEALDAANAVTLFVDAAEKARWAGEDTFGYGVLATVASAERDRALAHLPRLARRLA
ncbi:hypothetical protein AS850_05435 [Frondihabitans sp. 762G35]|uniref:CYTH and CHAD domain-containing protein n=1 Tax=Frondihabitans sp. 762G35 TaxID=1446794 RepID=UPI000D21735E|nr:CYTH and CHAD domain-containing protein [Frondihabitans sp. 762G35]ARC56515.1 hypothetical protein AS850_05435 [Frondihabitans sp. 762G35]